MIVLAGILAAGWSLLPFPKNVTLVIDGQTYPLQVVARDVQQLLEINQVRLTPYDQVTPPAQTRLTDGLTVTVERARAVILLDGEQQHTVYTTSPTPADWLAEANLTLQPGDRLYADGLEVSPDQASTARLLQIVHPAHLTLENGGQKQFILTSTATLGQALWQAGLRLRASDRLQPGLNTPAAEGLQAGLTPARNLTLQTASGSFQAFSAAQTVGEALGENGFGLQGLDYSLPAEDQPLPADGKIRVVRVQELVVSSQKVLPYQAEFQADPNTEIDQQSIIKAGVVGLEEQRQRVR